MNGFEKNEDLALLKRSFKNRTDEALVFEISEKDFPNDNTFGLADAVKRIFGDDTDVTTMHIGDGKYQYVAYVAESLLNGPQQHALDAIVAGRETRGIGD